MPPGRCWGERCTWLMRARCNRLIQGERTVVNRNHVIAIESSAPGSGPPRTAQQPSCASRTPTLERGGEANRQLIWQGNRGQSRPTRAIPNRVLTPHQSAAYGHRPNFTAVCAMSIGKALTVVPIRYHRGGPATRSRRRHHLVARPSTVQPIRLHHRTSTAFGAGCDGGADSAPPWIRLIRPGYDGAADSAAPRRRDLRGAAALAGRCAAGCSAELLVGDVHGGEDRLGVGERMVREVVAVPACSSAVGLA